MLFYIYDFFFGGFKDGVCLVWFSYLVNVAILFGPGFSAIVFFKLMFYLINIYEREGIRARAGCANLSLKKFFTSSFSILAKISFFILLNTALG